jgi:hypothetical protein
MAGKTIGQAAVILAFLLVLTGCEEGKGPSFLQPKPAETSSGGPIVAPDAIATPAAKVGQDAEAPEVFQVSDTGLWDGRPSLGGIWVAYGEVPTPERVVIRNLDNGKSIIGALFRRERENPGPKFQLSSDAAEGLGMLAGAPASISVTALRRVEPVAAPAPVEEQLPADQPVAEADAVAAISTTETIRASSLDPAEDIAGDALAAVVGVDQAPAPRPTNFDAEVAAVEPALPEVSEAAVPLTQPKPLARAYVEAGLYQMQNNAEAAATQLRAAGFSVEVLAVLVKATEAWRVVAGPAATKEDRTAMLEQMKAMGFTTAHVVRN